MPFLSSKQINPWWRGIGGNINEKQGNTNSDGTPLSTPGENTPKEAEEAGEGENYEMIHILKPNMSPGDGAT